MVKKVWFAVIGLCIMVSFCGCKGYRETENGYIVTALGFDKGKKDEFSISVEVVSAGGGETTNSPSSEILVGGGKSPGNAVFTLNDELSKTLIFDHCAVVILGEELTKGQTEEIFKYLDVLKELNLGVFLTTTKNSKELLTKSKSVSVARGFDIAGNIKESATEAGINYHNKFYEINKAYKNGELYSMPNLEVDNKKIVISGESVVKKEKNIAKLSSEESLVYSVLRNGNSGGRIYLAEDYAEIDRINSNVSKDGKTTFEFYYNKHSKGFSNTFKKEAVAFLKKYGKTLDLNMEIEEIKEREGV